MGDVSKIVDLDGLRYYNEKIKGFLNGKVDAENGKGLSTNDYTTAEKTKLSGVSSGAQVNVIENITVNGTAQTVTSKTVNVNVPTKTSDLTNNSNFVSDANYVHTDSNFTSAEKTKLSGVTSGAQPNVIESISVNGTAQTITSKGVNITVPTNNNQLTNGAGYQTASDVSTAIAGKVDAETGKGLSTNDYTTTEKTKLSGIASGAQVNVIESIKVNGTAQTVTSKGVNISVPTNNNQLTNGAGYQTASDVSSAIQSAISGITGISFSIVQSLPQTGTTGVIYLLSNSGSGTNIYDEYIYVDSKWEKIGTTDVDLTGYVKFTDLQYITNAEIDTIVSGSSS